MRAAAFVTRSIRQDSRLVSHHVMRAAMAGLILFMFGAEFSTFASKSAAGGIFAATVIQCCYWFVTLLGSIHFSTAIVEEKEEQTLALLKMTGALPVTILAGKSIPRLFVAILFLCVVAPFLILSVTLGGVLPLGLVSAILSIFCYAVMMSQVGLFASVICVRSSRAFLVTLIFWALIELSHWWFYLAIELNQELFRGTDFGALLQYVLEDCLYWVPQCSVINNLNGTLLAFATSSVWDSDVSFLTRLLGLFSEVAYLHMGFNLVVAAIFFLLSWALFERCTSRAVSEGSSDVTKVDALAAIRARPWNDAMAWKSWQHCSGGVVWFWLRAAGVPIFTFLLLTGISFFSGPTDGEFIFGMGLTLGIFFFLINVTRLGGRVFRDEIHGKTLATIMMLPRRNSETLWAMIIGLLPAIVAGAVCAVLGFLGIFFLTLDHARAVEDLFELLLYPWFWHFLSWVLLTLHLGVLLTTYVRYGGMVLAAVLLGVVAPICCVSTFSGVMFAGGMGRGGEDVLEYVVPILLILGELGICVAIQRALLQRLEDLAAS